MRVIEVKKDIEDTKQKYFINDSYTAERIALHDKIIADYVENFVKDENPHALFLGGGTAVGKSSLLGTSSLAFRVKDDSNYLTIDSDKIKTLLPEYQDYTTKNPSHAASRLHHESSDIANKLFFSAIDKRINFILDGTMKNEEKYSNYFDVAKKNNYETYMIVADAPLEIALEREKMRAFETGRKVPEEILRESHMKVAQVARNLENKADFVFFYDTQFASGVAFPIPFYIRNHEKVVHRDEHRLQQFFDKAKSLSKNFLFKDLLKQMTGIPNSYSQDYLTPDKLNRKVESYQVEAKGGKDKLTVKLEGHKPFFVSLEHIAFLTKDIKDQMIEQAASKENNNDMMKQKNNEFER